MVVKNVDVKYRRMSTWPGEQRPGDRTLSKKWTGPVTSTVAEIRDELGRMGCKECMIETDHPDGGYSRLDGTPKSDTAPGTPRIALWFEVGESMRVIRCEAHTTWQKNLKAIALTLQRNRLLRAYGTATVVEQYGGYVALPPGKSEAAAANGKPHPSPIPLPGQTEFAGPEQAALFLIDMAGRQRSSAAVNQLLRDGAFLRDIFRTAQRRHGARKAGENGAQSALINTARDVIAGAQQPAKESA